MTEEIIDTILPSAADVVEDLFPQKSITTPAVVPPSQVSTTSPSVWEKPVKVKFCGFISAEGELKPVLIVIGGLTLAGILYKCATRKKKACNEGGNNNQNTPPTPQPPLTTNRDNIGKPIEKYVPLIPKLAHCGDNVLLWGESKIGKSRLGFQWGIDLAQGHHSSLFPSETCLTPKHHVFYYAYELDEQDIRERYGAVLNQYENLQIIYASSRIGNPDSVLEDLEGRLKSVPEDAYVAVFFDTFAKAVGWGHAYDEKKAGEFLDKLMKLQDDFKASQNITISNIIIAHQKNDKDELEGPNCIRQTVKTEMRFVVIEKDRRYLLEHLRSNNMKTLDEPLRLHVEEEPYVQYVADEDEMGEEDAEMVENPFKENGDYDWEKLRPLLKKLSDEEKSQSEIAKTITELFGKETQQQSVSAAMRRLGI